MKARVNLTNLNGLVKDVNSILAYQIPVNLNDGGVIGSIVNWNLSENYNSNLTLTGNKTLKLNNLYEGDYGTIIIKQDSTGSRTLAIPSNSLVSGDGQGSLTLSTDPGSVDVASFYYDGQFIYWNLSKNFT